ncbi:MAG TPA: histidine kinase dimerization/phospho-acceptor domain-containing protein [Gemmatimonadaceae bacterium]|jgi:signal transduction histidine kinase
MDDGSTRASAGELAGRLQHGLNNALAALMAEAQLLELEELTPVQREAVERMVELCRHMTGLVRALDGLRQPPAASNDG